MYHMSEVQSTIQPPKPIRAIFCNLIDARQYKGKGDPKWDALFELDQADLDALKVTAIAVAKDKWPGRDLKELNFPFKTHTRMIDKAGKNAEKAGKDVAKAKARAAELYKEGKFYLKSATKIEPELSYFDGPKWVVYDDKTRKQAKKHFYNGAFLVPEFNFVAYAGDDDKDGITAYINLALFAKNGERIGGRSGAEAFKGYAGKVTNEDPTGGGLEDDDEIPF
jgi:hypothetical protein